MLGSPSRLVPLAAGCTKRGVYVRNFELLIHQQFLTGRVRQMASPPAVAPGRLALSQWTVGFFDRPDRSLGIPSGRAPGPRSVYRLRPKSPESGVGVTSLVPVSPGRFNTTARRGRAMGYMCAGILPTEQIRNYPGTPLGTSLTRTLLSNEDMVTPPSACAVSVCPQMVVLIEEDPAVLDMYSRYFESRAVGVSGAATPEEGLRAVAELRPDLVITDISFRTGTHGVDVVHRLKGRAETEGIPLVVLTDRPIAELPAGTRRDVELFLRKPITAERLLGQVRRLLKSAKTPERPGSSPRVRATPAAAGVCPRCAQGLDWIERGRLNGREYDYYRWCLRGCGLYCFDRENRKWIQLAPRVAAT